MKYVICGLVGLASGIVVGVLGFKVKEWLDFRELAQMIEPFDEDSCSGDCGTCGGNCEDGWDGK